VKEKVYTVIKPHFTVTEKEKHGSSSVSGSHSNSYVSAAPPVIDNSNSSSNTDDSNSDFTADSTYTDGYDSDASAIIDSMKDNL
jgi:hypothetical protein